MNSSDNSRFRYKLTTGTLTKQLGKQQDQHPAPASTTTPASFRPIAPLPTLTWAQKAVRAPPTPTTSTSASMKATPPFLTKRHCIIIIERYSTFLPDDTNLLTIRDAALNTAIKKPPTATTELTTNHYVLLLTKDNTLVFCVLKSYRSAIEEAIKATIPTASGLRKDEIWHTVILHSIPTTTTFTTVHSEIEEFNSGIQL